MGGELLHVLDPLSYHLQPCPNLFAPTHPPPAISEVAPIHPVELTLFLFPHFPHDLDDVHEPFLFHGYVSVCDLESYLFQDTVDT